jgi:hypothetical protein
MGGVFTNEQRKFGQHLNPLGSFFIVVCAALLALLFNVTSYHSRASSRIAMPQVTSSSMAPNDTCFSARYTTELLSLDPLIVYINDFLTLPEIEALLALGYARSCCFLGPHRKSS